MRRIKKNRQCGFTLMELLVAMTVFLVVISIASSTFVQAMRTQRTIVKLSEGMNNLSLAIEQIARETRTGFSFPSGDSGPSGDTQLNFITARGESVSYRLIDEDGDGVGSIGRCAESICGADSDFSPITSENVGIERLRFFINNPVDYPPRITVVATVRANQDIDINLQATVSSRILDP